MDQRTITDLLARVQRLEAQSVRFRRGVVTNNFPLAVDLGSSGVSYENVVTLDGVVPAIDDHVAVLTWGNDMLVLGVLNV